SDIAGRPQAFVGKAEAGDVVAERRHFQRIFRAAHARPGDRVDPDQFRALLDRAGLQASDFGLGAPWFTLGGLKKYADTHRQRDEDEGADKIQTNSVRHRPHVQPIYLKTLQRIDFTNFLPCFGGCRLGGTREWTATLPFLDRERFASLKCYLRARRNPGSFPQWISQVLS